MATNNSINQAGALPIPLTVANGGTGLATLTLNSYYKGNATSNPIARTYAEVLSDIGAAATGQQFYIGTTQVAINRGSAALTLAGLTLTTPEIGNATGTSLHLTTLLTDHIGEHTGSHGIIMDNGITATTINLPTNGQIVLTIPSTDGHATGPVTSEFQSGYSSTAVGDLVYLDSSSQWQKTDMGTSVATYGGYLSIALEAKAANNALKVALSGSYVYCTAFPPLTIGSPVWMGDTGAIVVTRPDTVDHANRMIGHAVHENKIWFCPSNDYVIYKA